MTFKEGIEIGKANEALAKAKALVDQAYALVDSDPIARKYLKMDCSIGWKTSVWNKLNEEYATENPTSKDVWHWRAFNYFNLDIGVNVSTDGMVSCSGG